MNATQKVLFRLMVDFDEICRKYDIEYFLAGGTALGAVRNGGFLPWDDDVDIFVTADDYKKLNEIMDEACPKDRTWASEENNPGYWNPIARFFDLNTTCVVKDKLDDGMPGGHCLEIFRLDPYPRDPKEQEKFNKNLWLYSEVGSPRFLSANFRFVGNTIAEKPYYDYMERLEKEGRTQVVNELEQGITYPKEECSDWCLRWSYRVLVLKDEWIREKVYFDFEGVSFPLPKEYVRFLVATYNSDWNLIPSKEDRQIHPGIENTKKSYKVHEDRIRKLCEESNFSYLLHENKYDRLHRIFTQKEKYTRVVGIKRAYLKELVKKLEEKTWEFSLDELDEYHYIFEEFFNTFLSLNYKVLADSIDIREDLFKTMALSLLYANRIDDSVYFSSSVSSGIKEDVFKICNGVKELKIARYGNNCEKVKELLDTLRNDFELKKQLEVERTYAWHVSKCEEYSDINKIEKFYETLYNQQDEEVKKYVGDMYYDIQEYRKAYELYEDAANGNNGVILQDLRKKGVLKGESLSKESLKVSNLLKEFDEICRKLNIKYIVGGSIPEIFVNEYFKNFEKTQVYMNSKDLGRFVEYFEKTPVEDREIEYYGNNPSYPFFNVRYVDSNSTYIDSLNTGIYKCMGMHLELVPLRSMRPSKFDRSFWLEKSNMQYDRLFYRDVALGHSLIKQKIISTYSKVFSSASEERRKNFFYKLCDKYAIRENQEYFYLSSFRHQFKKTQMDCFINTEERNLFGYKIIVPQNIALFYKKLYKYKGKVVIPSYKTGNIMINPNRGYREYPDSIIANNDMKNRLLELNQIYDKITFENVSRVKIVNSTWKKIYQLYSNNEGD